MTTDYGKVKAEVLEQYDAFLSLAQEVKGDAPSTFDSSLRQLQTDVEKIKKNIFRLMIAGEAKSGKSTFINAYLGKEILPMDVKQCTSAIVEICDGEKYRVKAIYADDRVEIFDQEEDIEKFLKENAALDDEHREIPVSTINLQLIIPNKGKRILEAEIKKLLGEIANSNFYKLPPVVYEKKVREYIEMKNPHWKDLVQAIEIEYPFEDENLKGIRIVDSPGINAEGRVGDITRDYIGNVDAVMFLKSIVGSPVEAISFQEFLKSASVGRNSNAMFLVLTRTANENLKNVEKIHEEARKQLPDFNEKQIIRLDSKVAMFRNKIKAMTEEELKIFMKQKIDEADWYDKQIKSLSEEERNVFITKYKDADILDTFLSDPWFRSHEDRDDYIQRLDGISNFKQLDVALDQFGRTAQFNRLSEVLGRMRSVLEEKIRLELVENIKLYREKVQDPAELESKLGHTAKVLVGLENKMGYIVRSIPNKYTDTENSIIDDRSLTIMEKYEKELAEIDPNEPACIEELEKLTFRKIEEFKKFEAEITKNIIAECDETLIVLSQKEDLLYTSLLPDMTSDTLAEVESESLAQAMENYTTGVCFKETHERLNQSRYFNIVSNDIKGKLENIKTDVGVSLKDYVYEVIFAYRKELAHNIEVQQDNYKRILEDKANAEEMHRKIEEMEGQLDQVPLRISSISILKGGIDKHVCEKSKSLYTRAVHCHEYGDREGGAERLFS